MQKTLLLSALYLDFAMLLALQQLVCFALGTSYSWPISWAVSFAFSLVLYVLGRSLGQWLTENIRIAIGSHTAGRALWLNLGIGLLFYLDSMKHFVRWTSVERAMPFFGYVLEGASQVALQLALGFMLLLAGCLLLRMHRYAKVFAGAAILVLIASILLSWSLLPEAISLELSARRSSQGLPVREGQLEFMKTYFPIFSLGCLVLLLVGVALSADQTSQKMEGS